MTASCKGVCHRFESKPFGNLRYDKGYKICSYCDVFMKINVLRCPCCTLILRTKSRVNPKRRSKNHV